ncbi:hypothetical protein DFJ58DRAFT_794103 [Suillus subalutaceus]|uniref:uncharacterized protein n=1 Tax=Suillus subalutaceus TaxID=48586 RepID=UPI001B871F03|nr:uncharacterized protein DFJ58DRAFT_794103 [Suillus subalutaceus]KAG1850212.1 hypothetical protein DFJ58DRAFT_794103 [Suillus subalutaceus]
MNGVPDSKHRRSTWTPAFVIPAFISPQAPTMIPILRKKWLVESLITTAEQLAQMDLPSNIITTLASIKLLVGNLITAVEHLSQKTDILSSDVGAAIALLVENLITAVTHNVLASDIHHLLQGCIALVVLILLCLLTVLCIVRWCYAFSRELRGVQHLKTT